VCLITPLLRACHTGSDVKADEKQPGRGTRVYRGKFKIWRPAGWSGTEQSE
ncbi:Hypothetical predicted protein, partial [Xyrichtys novacula]